MKRGWTLVLVASLAVYSNSFENGYHYDDEHSIQFNESIRSLANVPAFFVDPGAFSDDPSKGMYRPLLLITFTLNYTLNQALELDGYDVRGFHVVNLLLHAFTACFLWWLVALHTGRRDTALVAGLLFALHPLGTEPVNYLSSRSEGLASFFYMIGLTLYVRAVAVRAAGFDHRWLAASWAVLALGLLSKSTVITLPAVVMLYDYLFIARRDLGRLKHRLLRVYAPYWLISLGYILLITATQFLTKSLGSPVRDVWSQLLTQVQAFSYYLALLFWPTELNVEHQFFTQRTMDWTTAGAILVLVSFLWGMLFLYRRRHDLALFLAGWGTIAVLPVMVMPLNVLVNERRLYLTCAAFCVGFALLLRSNWLRRRRLGPADLGVALALVVGGVYAGLTYDRNRAWLDDFSLWTDSVAKAPLMPRSNLYLGNAYKDRAIYSGAGATRDESWQLAAASYEQVIKVAYDREHHDLALRALNNLGSVRFMLQDFDAAERAYLEAVQLNPQYADAIVNVGNIHLVRGRKAKENGRATDRSLDIWGEGIKYYERALRIAPNHYAAYGMKGLTNYELGQYRAARGDYERAITINPRDYSSLLNLGNLSVTQAELVRQRGEGGTEQLRVAEIYYRRALKVNPTLEEAQNGLERIVEMRAELGVTE